jgi:hypothetical protein
LHAQATQFSAIALNGNSNLAFMLGAPASLAALFATEEALIDLDAPGEFGAPRKDRACSQLLEPAPSGLVAPQPKELLQGFGIDTVLSSREPPQGFEPERQRLSGPVKNGPCRDRVLMPALAAEIKATGACPITGMAASDTAKSLGPTKLKKILKASSFRAKPAVKLNFVFWKI